MDILLNILLYLAVGTILAWLIRRKGDDHSWKSFLSITILWLPAIISQIGNSDSKQATNEQPEP